MNADIKVSITGDSSSFKQAARQVEADVDRVNAAAQKMNGALSAGAERFDKVGSAAVKMRGALSTVSPEAAMMAGAVDDAADAVEGIGRALSLSTASLGVIGIAIAAAGAAYLYFSHQVAQAEEAMAAAAKAATEAQEAAERMGKMRSSIADKYAIATGKATEKDLKLRDAIGEVTAEFGPRIKAEQDALALAKESVARGKLGYMTIDKQAEAQASAKAEIDRANAAIAGLTREQGKYIDMTVVATLTEKEATKAHKERTKAVTKEAEAVIAYSDAQTGANAAIEGYAAQFKAAEDASEAKAKVEQEAIEASVAAAIQGYAEQNAAAVAADDKRRAQREQLIDGLSEIERAGADLALDILGRVEDRYAEMVANNMDAFQSAQATIDETRDLLDGLREPIDAAKLSGDALVEAYREGEVAADDLSSAQKSAIAATLAAEAEAAKERSKLARRGALEAFEAQKKASMGQAVILGIQSVLQALAAAPPPINIGLAAIAATAAGLQIAAIKAQEPPAFHAGGIIGAGESRALPGEVMLNRSAVQDLGGPAAANALNSPSGRAPMASPTVIRIGRLESAELIRTDVRGGGALPEYVRSMTRRGTKGAGRSGRLAAA